MIRYDVLLVLTVDVFDDVINKGSNTLADLENDCIHISTLNIYTPVTF